MPALPLDAYALCVHTIEQLNCSGPPAPADVPAEALLVPKVEEPNAAVACTDGSTLLQVISTIYLCPHEQRMGSVLKNGECMPQGC